MAQRQEGNLSYRKDVCNVAIEMGGGEKNEEAGAMEEEEQSGNGQEVEVEVEEEVVSEGTWGGGTCGLRQDDRWKHGEIEAIAEGRGEEGRESELCAGLGDGLLRKMPVDTREEGGGKSRLDYDSWEEGEWQQSCSA